MYINPLANSIKQGLDLQGGTHVVLQAVETPEAKIDDDALNRTVKIIERRVNELGLTEPVIQRQGKDRIIVELICLAVRLCWSLKTLTAPLF